MERRNNGGDKWIIKTFVSLTEGKQRQRLREMGKSNEEMRDEEEADGGRDVCWGEEGKIRKGKRKRGRKVLGRNCGERGKEKRKG